MKWIPTIFQPFDWVMSVLVLIWFFTCALFLQRVSRYLAQWRSLRRWPAAINLQQAAIASGRVSRGSDPLLAQLDDLVRNDPREEALDEFHTEHVMPLREPDQANDRALQGVSQVAPLVGLLGTVLGLLNAFVTVGGATETLTLRDLGIPVSSALMTTAHGALCAGLCIAARTVLATKTLHDRQDRLLFCAWKKFVAAQPPPPERSRPIESSDLFDGSGY